MRALITGVTGQDGSYLAELLLEKGYKVIGVTRRASTNNTERIAHIRNKNFLLVEGDITDYSSMLGLIREYTPDEIYHLAAMSHVGTSFKQPLCTWDVTAKGCMNVLDAVKSVSNEYYQPKFINAGSSEQFGDNYRVNRADNKKYQDEDTAFNPQSPYAIAKVAAFDYTRLYRESYNLFCCSTICFNHESPRRGENFVTRKVTKYLGELHRFCPDLKTVRFTDMEILTRSGPYPKLKLGNLAACRDWSHAKDMVRAMWMVLQEDVPKDYVVASGETHSVQEFVEDAFACTGIDNWGDFVVQDQSLFRPSEVPYLLGDSSRIRHELGWKPEYNFSQLVQEMVEADCK